MRLAMLSWLMLVIVTLGRTHGCEAVFVLPDGQKCQTCPTLGSQSEEITSLASIETNCLDCCTLTDCPVEHDDAVKAAVSEVPPALMPSAIALPKLNRTPTVRQRHRSGTEPYLPNAPPGPLHLRAPPSQLS